ncbi:MAG TPA: L,D-transpeptidase [Actinomycetota bacterium]|nr:L,D-transpeptidase [Actinomycetota bacterium]
MRHRSRHSRLAIVLTLAVGLLTPMAANMVGARAGASGSVRGTVVVAVVAAPRPRGFAAPASGVRPDPVLIVRAAERVARWTNVLVHVPHTLPAYGRPRAGASQIGVVPRGSKYYGIPIVAWVEQVSDDGRWGLVELPYTWPRREGWIRLKGLKRDATRVRVEVDLSQHMVTVRKFGKVLFRAPGATGATYTPTPVGEYFVTDRVPFSGGSYGTFAFGISGIQPRLPGGWTGGNQLAIHGTNNPSSIGRSASAGCIRVSESTLDRLLPLLGYGTPVIIHA